MHSQQQKIDVPNSAVARDANRSAQNAHCLVMMTDPATSPFSLPFDRFRFSLSLYYSGDSPHASLEVSTATSVFHAVAHLWRRDPGSFYCLYRRFLVHR